MRNAGRAEGPAKAITEIFLFRFESLELYCV